MTEHAQVLIGVGDLQALVDAELAPLVTSLWEMGFNSGQ
jgi:hypothetical protein